MKCEECEALIDEYLDGELDRAAREIDAHLSGCAKCSAVYEEARRELETLMRYEREVDVTPALWAAVEARIKQEKPVRHQSWLGSVRERLAHVFVAPRLSPAFAAALVLVAIGVTVAVTTFINSRGGEKNSNVVAVSPNNNTAAPTPNAGDGQVNPQVQTPTNSNHAAGAPTGDKEVAPMREKNAPAVEKQQVARANPAAGPAAADKLVREAEQKYLAAINLLERDVKRTKLDPAIRARFEVALADINRTISETRKVVRQNPGDPGALQYLLGAYSKKVDVLRDMSREVVAEDQD